MHQTVKISSLKKIYFVADGGILKCSRKMQIPFKVRTSFKEIKTSLKLKGRKATGIPLEVLPRDVIYLPDDGNCLRMKIFFFFFLSFIVCFDFTVTTQGR